MILCDFSCKVTNNICYTLNEILKKKKEQQQKKQQQKTKQFQA